MLKRLAKAAQAQVCAVSGSYSHANTPPMPPRLNLKQRLAALSQATSSPTAPRSHSFDSLDPPQISAETLRRKLNIPWGRKDQSQDSDVYQDDDAVRDVISKMIFQAGVDYETKPMVVINASALPDPQKFSYDVLLSRILDYLNLYVESDYTVVFFAAGGRHTPGWNWVWKAYRSLSRKYRKNLKQLYIVHSSFFTKMLFSLAGAMISPKFFRKIIYIETLSDLARHVPITQIDIPPAVYRENLKHEARITLPVPNHSNIFGVPLEDLMGHNGEKGVPKVVRDCIQFLRETGLREEGLFRRSPQSSMLRAAQEAYDRGNTVSLQTFGDPHIATVLLKKFLRDLPDPIIPERLYPIIQRCPIPSSDPSDTSSIQYVRESLLPELAPCAYILLSHIFYLMHDVNKMASINRMDGHNLAAVLCPNLIKGQNLARDIVLCSLTPEAAAASPYEAQASTRFSASDGERGTLGMIVKLCIERYHDIFGSPVEATSTSPITTTFATTTTVDSDLDLTTTTLDTTSSLTSLGGSTAVESPYLGGKGGEEDEEIDDAMLVMPIGPSHGRNGSASGSVGNVGLGRNGRPSPGGYKVRRFGNKPT